LIKGSRWLLGPETLPL